MLTTPPAGPFLPGILHWSSGRLRCILPLAPSASSKVEVVFPKPSPSSSLTLPIGGFQRGVPEDNVGCAGTDPAPSSADIHQACICRWPCFVYEFVLVLRCLSYKHGRSVVDKIIRTNQCCGASDAAYTSPWCPEDRPHHRALYLPRGSTFLQPLFIPSCGGLRATAITPLA